MGRDTVTAAQTKSSERVRVILSNRWSLTMSRRRTDANAQIISTEHVWHHERIGALVSSVALRGH